MPEHDQADHDHGVVEHMDAAATLSEREPALGAGSPLTALGCVPGIVVVSAILELVRSQVSPAAINPFGRARPRHSMTAPR